ncbi:MAG: ABC transporter ATP-binding protein [Candidatus Eisenbacteria bacterium]|uniref:ABC transporter ATP-binding protein n=1 Tax=Eiseniibacteriota bacterium TaxID=2212470 RepID=A0A538SF80_UNCEI|nr:MAG: ABC transporter ATP-binding protein [Candidatus Eisenbacteria bacterium]
MNPSRSTDLALFRRLLLEVRPYLPHMGLLLLVGLLATPLTLVTPLPLKIAVDTVLGSHPLPGPVRAALPRGMAPTQGQCLAIAVGLLVATALLKQGQDLANNLLKKYVVERMTLDLRARVFRHAHRLSFTYHDRQGTADAAYRIQQDVPDAQSIVVESVFPSITAFITLVSMFLVTAKMDWQLALVALSITPILFFVNRHYRRQFRGRWRAVKNLESSALAVIHEALGALRVVKAFGQEDREESRFLDRSGQGMWARIRLTAYEGGFGLQVGVLTAIGTAGVLWLGVQHVRTGVLTLGQLLVVMGYLTQLYDPLKTLSRKAATFQSKLTSAERVFSLIDNPPDVREKPRARSLARARGEIEFRHVSFGYTDRRTVLENVSFALPAGARLGITGPTGAGKTTLVSLLLRFYDPAEGEILLDGVDLRDYRIADLRNQFALVLQEPVLFSSSIGENIAYARPGASDQAIVEAAKVANAHEFITRLPQGYDTVVGERGMSLSGGERQRISLARAFLKDAPILVLDEPTSAVDLRTEALIIGALEQLMRGRTTLMIAHRLSTLESCDHRLDVDHGRVHEGRPAAPLAQGLK